MDKRQKREKILLSCFRRYIFNDIFSGDLKYTCRTLYIEKYRLFLLAFQFGFIFTVDMNSKIRIDWISWIISLAERLEILVKRSVRSKNPQKYKYWQKTLIEKRAAVIMIKKAIACIQYNIKWYIIVCRSELSKK